MSKYTDDDPVLSGYSILALASFGIGALIDYYVFHHQPPIKLLLGLGCLFILFDSLNGIKRRAIDIEGKLDAILKKLNDE
jgi:hypothetical protein